MAFETIKSLELEEASKQVNIAFERWNGNRTVENERLLNEAKEYCGRVAYEVQRCKMHEELVDNGYEFDFDDEEIVIEYVSAWSADLLEIAEALENKDIRKISFDEYVEQYVVEAYGCRAGEQGVEILREFQRWLPTDQFKEFVRDHYTNDEENIVENFEDDYIIILDR